MDKRLEELAREAAEAGFKCTEEIENSAYESFVESFKANAEEGRTVEDYLKEQGLTEQELKSRLGVAVVVQQWEESKNDLEEEVMSLSDEELKSTAGGLSVWNFIPGVAEVSMGIDVITAKNGEEAGRAVGEYVGATAAVAEVVSPIPGGGIAAGIAAEEVGAAVGRGIDSI